MSFLKRKEISWKKWAEDMIFAAEEALRDTKMQIKSLKREARLAQSIEEQKAKPRKS